MIDQPRIVQTQAQPAAVIRLTIPRAEIRNAMGPGIAELMATVAAQGIGPAGPVFSHHLSMDPGTFDLEIGVPVTGPVSPAGRVKAGQLPAARVARTVYHGPYEGLGPAWAEFGDWLAAEGPHAGAGSMGVLRRGPRVGSRPRRLAHGAQPAPVALGALVARQGEPGGSPGLCRRTWLRRLLPETRTGGNSWSGTSSASPYWPGSF